MENGLQKLLGAKMFRAALPKSIFRVLIAFVAFWGLGALFQNCSQGFETSPYEMMSTMEKQVEEHSIQTKKLSTTFDLQLSDRNYVAGVLEDVFGPSAKTKLTEMVTRSQMSSEVLVLNMLIISTKEEQPIWTKTPTWFATSTDPSSPLSPQPKQSVRDG